MHRKVIPRNRRFVCKSPLMFGGALHPYKVVTVIEFVSFITNFYPFQFGFVIRELIIYNRTSSFKFRIFVHHPKSFCGRLSARSDYCYALSYQFYKKFVLLFRYYEPYILEMSEYHNSFHELTFFISFTKFIFRAIVVSSASRDTLFNLGVCFRTNVSIILQKQI